MTEAVMLLLRRMLSPEPWRRPDCTTIVEHAGLLQLGPQATTSAPDKGFCEAESVVDLRRQREAELREAIRLAEEAAESSRQRGESMRLELEAMKQKVGHQCPNV